MAVQKPARLHASVGLLSFLTGAGWTLAWKAHGAGYWSWPLSWWLLAIVWGGTVAIAVAVMRWRSAVPAALIAIVTSLAGGFTALFTLIAIYGTGD